MANSISGEFDLIIGDIKYAVKVTLDTLAKLEDEFETDFTSIFPRLGTMMGIRKALPIILEANGHTVDHAVIGAMAPKDALVASNSILTGSGLYDERPSEGATNDTPLAEPNAGVSG